MRLARTLQKAYSTKSNLSPREYLMKLNTNPTFFEEISLKFFNYTVNKNSDIQFADSSERQKNLEIFRRNFKADISNFLE